MIIKRIQLAFIHNIYRSIKDYFILDWSSIHKSFKKEVDVNLNKNINIIVDFSGIGTQRFKALKDNEKDWICMTIGNLVMQDIESLRYPMTFVEKTREFYNAVEHALHCR